MTNPPNLTQTPLIENWHAGGFLVSEARGHRSRDVGTRHPPLDRRGLLRIVESGRNVLRRRARGIGDAGGRRRRPLLRRAGGSEYQHRANQRERLKWAANGKAHHGIPP